LIESAFAADTYRRLWTVPILIDQSNRSRNSSTTPR